MELAMYRGPGKTLLHKAVHRLICAVTKSQYSHCELVIQGTCYTSSNRDGGVRGKKINLAGWDVFEIQGDEQKALRWFQAHEGEGYDWIGALRFLLPFLPNNHHKWFCSEACAAALGISDAHTITPQMLLDYVSGD